MFRRPHLPIPLAAEVEEALTHLFLRRSRLLMLVGIGATIFFIVATHLLGWAQRWSHVLNLFVAALLGTGLLLSRLPTVQRHMVGLFLLLASVFSVVRALAGIWYHDIAATAIFMVVVAIIAATTLPWGWRPQLGMACVVGGGIALSWYIVTGGFQPESGRAAANVALGLGASVILAWETRRHHTRLRIDSCRRRDAEAALARLNAELEQRIDERTAELKQAQQAALQHQANLAHVLRVGTMGEMASALAHEINQPLGAIANYAQGCVRRLRAGSVNNEALLPIVERIGGEALRAGEVIRRLRDLIRKDSGEQVRADLNHLVRESARLIEPEARARDVTLRLDLARELPTVSCNDIQIEQVLLNLLLNGIEAVEVAANGERVVSVHTALDGDTIAVGVRDTGVGLPAPPADVFAPFYTTKASGLGMGLSISRSIIEAHGGRLWGTDNPEQGSTFHFTLPTL